MSAAQPLSPQAVAERATEVMWASDHASRGLDMAITAVGPGSAVLEMTITAAMVNGHQTAHGGYIFTLADSAFAFACNAYGDVAVGAQCSIAYIAPARLGDRLVASAREVLRSGRTGIYDVRVSVGDATIAEFRGQSRIVGGSFIAAEAK